MEKDLSANKGVMVMDRDNCFYEPKIANVVRSFRSCLNPTRGAEESIRQAWAVYSAFEPLLPMRSDSNYKEVWFMVERGEANDWMSFEDYCSNAEEEEEPVPSRADWESEWQSWFPEEKYWHVLGCREEEGFLVVAIDGNVLISVSPDEKNSYEDESLVRVLAFLAEEVKEIVGEMQCDHYHSRIEKELPLKHRYGLIKRSDLWATADSWYRFGNVSIGDKDLRCLIEMLESQPSKERLGRMDELSAGCYFEKLKGAYLSAGYENDQDWISGISSEDGRSWYARFGDARDYSLLELAPDSFEGFKSWYIVNKNRLDHNFEIFAGRGCSRVHLNPVLDDNGWYLVMWGSITWHAADMAQVWKFMNDAGIPTYIYDADKLVKSLKGDDYILIVPAYNSTDYVRGEHFGHDIVTAIHLPEENQTAILEYVEWQPVKLAQLAHRGE